MLKGSLVVTNPQVILTFILDESYGFQQRCFERTTPCTPRSTQTNEQS